MKVLESSQTRLTLHHKPFQSWFWGACLIAIGTANSIIFAGFTSVATTLSFTHADQNQVKCQMSEFTVLGMVTHHSFENVQVASVATGTRSKGGPYYYVTLTNNGIETEIPNSEGQQNTADQINAFIHSGRSSLFISYNQRFQFGIQHG